MNDWRKRLLFYSIISMMVSLFCSRVILSVCMMIFVAVSFFHTDFKKHIRYFFLSPLLWSMSLLFFLPLLSGLWSEDKKEWLDIIRIKLPLLFLPLAFAGPFQFSKKEWESLALIFIILVTAGTIWSMFYYIMNLSSVHEGYLHSKTITTVLENDHVRFSWMISTAVLLAAWLWITKRKQGSLISKSLPVIIIWLILFLHILAARTGLLSFYLLLLFTIFWLIYKRSKPAYTIISLAAIIALPFAAYLLLPTFQNRVKYFLYDRTYFKDAHYLQGSNDAVRVISLKAGWNVMNEHPANGIGFGDVFAETKKWYSIHYLQMAESDKIYPSSEWMIYGAACGWPGLLVFTCIMLVPFLLPMKNKLPWWLLNITAAASFLFDIGLEVQFGIFIYSFVVLWWWKWLNAEKM
jgi:O-antigen ligase